MRPIKFRAWDVYNKKWLPPEIFSIGIDDGKLRNKRNDGIIGGVELVQFTGLLDKNGKEIYEGDIVRHIPSAFDRNDAEGVIFWFQGHCRFALEKPNGHFLDSLNDYEIIGNIYENPNLLKGD